MVAAQNEDDVVGGRSDRHRCQQVDRECRQPDEVVVAEEGDDASGSAQLEENHHQHQHGGHYRAIDQKQHHEDDDQGHRGDLLDALVSGVMLVVSHRGRAGDVDHYARRRRHLRHRVADRLNGLAGKRLALVAGQVNLNVGRFSIGALRSGRSQRVTPEVLNVLDVGGIRSQFCDQTVIEVVRIRAKGCVALQHDHRRTVGVELVENLADAFHRLQRRSVVGSQRHRVLLSDDLELGHADAENDHQADPEQQDRYREETDEFRYRRMRADMAVGRVVLGQHEGGLLAPQQLDHWIPCDRGKNTDQEISPCNCSAYNRRHEIR